MARYQVRNVPYADEQLSQLPRSWRTAFDARVEDLKDNPYAVGDPHEHTRTYTTTFGEVGIILYMISDEIAMVTVLRVNWVQM
jgi:mRNA-degrading endonuclease RelE of RelBE toxin-antitoxin system